MFSNRNGSTRQKNQALGMRMSSVLARLRSNVNIVFQQPEKKLAMLKVRQTRTESQLKVRM